MENKILLIVSIVMLTLVLISINVNSHKSTNPQTIPTPSQPVTKIIYNDSDNYLTINIPLNWKRIIDFGSETRGLHTAQPTTTKLEVLSFSSPNKTGINVLVYEGIPSCANIQKSNTTLAGLPAYYDPKHTTWIINTANATYAIIYHYPGVGITHPRYRISDTGTSIPD